MAATQIGHYELSLDVRERDQLLALLNQALVDVHAEVRRTEAHDYQDLLHEQQAFLTRFRDKLARLEPAGAQPDVVDMESEQSFPASDAPSWTR